MSEIPPWLIALVAVVAMYQAYVTLAIARSGLLTRTQLLTQCALIWLLPLLGAVVCHWFYALHRTYEKSSRPARDSLPDPLQPGPVNELVE